jgi:hypothetical protein
MASVIKSVRDNLSGTIDRLLSEVEGINIGLFFIVPCNAAMLVAWAKAILCRSRLQQNRLVA